MKPTLPALLLCLWIPFALPAQTVTIPEETGQYCNFTGSRLLQVKGIYAFTSEEEAQEVMQDVLSRVGLKPNFVVQAAAVPNAAAWINHQRRYILYNPEFMLAVRNSTQTDWSAISILAHEIGHHLNGHTLTLHPDRHQNELDADEFSGFILRKMGATLEEAQAAVHLLIDPRGNETHPGRALRLQAIARGWQQAEQFLRETGPPPEPALATTTSQDDPIPAGKAMEATPPVFAKWRVGLTHNPDQHYFITREDTFVVLREGSVEALGQMEASNNERFPFLIRMDHSPDLLVSPDMDLLNRKGTAVGFLEKM